MVILTIESLLCIGNMIYYEFYKSFLSVSLLSTASMIGGVNDSLFAKLHIYQAIYLIFPLTFVFIHIRLKKTNYYETVKNLINNKKWVLHNVYTILVLIVLFFITVTGGELRSFSRQWSKEYIVQHMGLLLYTGNDLIQSIQPKLNTLFGYDASASAFRNYYACDWKKKNEVNEFTNYFKGKNVLFIHAESIQNFLINLNINNTEITPTLNKLASEGLYFSKFYPQISVGTSSDTEFTLTTGLLPSSSGTVFVNYYDREYKALPNYFNNIGYYTFSMHGNDADYWNRKLMYKTLGYKDFYAKDTFIIPEEDSDDFIGLGISDKNFYNQIIPILSNIKSNNTNFMGTIISLSNHSPFQDIEKYGILDLTKKYNYKDEDGNTIKGDAPYLTDTDMGNYIMSAHYADSALNELINNLDESGVLDNTVIVIYGDHEARLSKNEFDLLYNYDSINDRIKDNTEEGYIDLDNYQYDLLKNTPFIIWTKDEMFNREITDVMGMYDVLPTIANMFGINEKYSLGNDIFSSREKIVVFPNGNVLTNKVYYSNLYGNYIAFTNEIIESDYIERISDYANKILEVSNGIITHDLIKNESGRIGECVEK